jgi:hypothetical protein
MLGPVLVVTTLRRLGYSRMPSTSLCTTWLVSWRGLAGEEEDQAEGQNNEAELS